MIRRLLTLVFLTALLALASCASTNQLVPFPDQSVEVENPELGRIYVMRPSSLGGAISMAVEDDQRLIGHTGPDSYLCWEREPGTATITGRAENVATLSIDVTAGSVTYVHQGMRMGMWKARNVLKLLDEEKGKKELAGCDPPDNAPEDKLGARAGAAPGAEPAPPPAAGSSPQP